CVVIVLVAFIAAYAGWARSGRSFTPPAPMMFLKSTVEYGTDSGRGNVLCIQPYMLTSDYASDETLYQKLDAYLREADRRGWLNRKTVVVFPEYIGAWLVVAGEKRGVYEAPTADRAMKLMAASNPVSFIRAAASAEGRDRLKDALFRMKAKEISGSYYSVFAPLAADYGVTIVAGSVVLPSPKVEFPGFVGPGRGPLYNACAVFTPAPGACDRLAVKSYPTKEEQAFIAAGKVEDLPVFDTPAGRLGVLVCADAWFPEAYETLKRQKVSIVVVPSFGVGDANVLKRKWTGYSGWPNPTDVAPGATQGESPSGRRA
ncbi:MAG: carbon-nitrogen hydrolase family protein, partial [Armatimonadetes bacterium]|nr:carbon-nitrogen hydrolase family protein [Armatimonadota bacterium]